MVTGADHERIAHLMAGGYALVALAAYLAWAAPQHARSAGAAPSGAAVISAVPRRATTGGSHDD